MWKYTLRRIAITIPIIAIVAFFVFSILYITPGDPAAIMAGDNANAEDIARVRAQLGLDQGYLQRFVGWGANVLSGDFGTSFYTRLPVIQVIQQRLVPTASLIVLTLLITVAVAIPLGVIAAVWHGSWIDRTAMLISVVGFSVPSFVVGYVLAYFFGLRLGWLPIQGFVWPSVGGLWQSFLSLVLPSVALASLFIALVSRVTRSTMLEVLNQDYVRTARAKGLSEFVVVFIHALKNAAVPISTVIGLGFASLLGGAVVIETVFAVPGLGLLMVNSILSRDYPVIQGILLLFSIAYVLVNLGVDLLYAVFDPRIRY